MTTWHTVAKKNELPAGQRKCVDAQGQHIVLLNENDNLYAFENQCPHAGLPLAEGSVAGQIIVCPYHGYTFNLKTGKNVDYEDDIPLKTFPIRIENDEIQVEIETKA